MKYKINSIDYDNGNYYVILEPNGKTNAMHYDCLENYHYIFTLKLARHIVRLYKKDFSYHTKCKIYEICS